MTRTRIRYTLSKLGPLAAAAPLLFTFVYVSHCAGGHEGFVFELKVGHVHVTATSCK